MTPIATSDAFVEGFHNTTSPQTAAMKAFHDHTAEIGGAFGGEKETGSGRESGS